MADVHFSDHVLAQVLSRAIHIIVQVQRFADGRRRVTHVSEITGAEGPMIALQDIFLFRTTGIGEAGAVRGVFQGASMPRCFERLETSGVPIDPSKFDVRREV
jgi:pilus assembly protein CpaF